MQATEEHLTRRGPHSCIAATPTDAGRQMPGTPRRSRAQTSRAAATDSTTARGNAANASTDAGQSANRHTRPRCATRPQLVDTLLSCPDGTIGGQQDDLPICQVPWPCGQTCQRSRLPEPGPSSPGVCEVSGGEHRTVPCPDTTLPPRCLSLLPSTQWPQRPCRLAKPTWSDTQQQPATNMIRSTQFTCGDQLICPYVDAKFCGAEACEAYVSLGPCGAAKGRTRHLLHACPGGPRASRAVSEWSRILRLPATVGCPQLGAPHPGTRAGCTVRFFAQESGYRGTAQVPR